MNWVERADKGICEPVRSHGICLPDGRTRYYAATPEGLTLRTGDTLHIEEAPLYWATERTPDTCVRCGGPRHDGILSCMEAARLEYSGKGVPVG